MVQAAHEGHEEVSWLYNVHKFSIEALTTEGQYQIRQIVSEYMHII